MGAYGIEERTMRENSKLREPKKEASLPAKKEAGKASGEALVLGLIIGLGIFASTSLWLLPVLVYRARYRSIVGKEPVTARRLPPH